MLCMLWVYYHTAKNFGNKTLAALGLEASNRYVGSVPVPFSAQYPSAVAVAVVIPAVTVTIAATALPFLLPHPTSTPPPLSPLPSLPLLGSLL